MYKWTRCATSITDYPGEDVPYYNVLLSYDRGTDKVAVEINGQAFSWISMEHFKAQLAEWFSKIEEKAE